MTSPSNPEPYIYGDYIIRKCVDTECPQFNIKKPTAHFHVHNPNGIAFICTEKEKAEMIALTQTIVSVITVNDPKAFHSLHEFVKQKFEFGLPYSQYIKDQIKYAKLSDLKRID